MASTYLTRTPGSTSSTTITTHSLWFKRSELENDFLYINFENGTNYGYIGFDSDSLDVRSSPGYVYVTTQKLRDPSAWYHLVVAVDNSLGTASDRVKIYLNGSRVTSFSTQTDPTSGAVNNLSVDNTTSNLMNVGGYSGGNHFGGSMSYVAFVDGTAELPTIFGETDSVTGQWKIKTDITPSAGWGTNGFLILKDGNSLTDESTNSNNFTLGGGTLTNTLDCPDNVFATLNSLDIGYTSNLSLSNGNNTTNQTSNWGDYGIRSTLAATTGKYYWEAKITTSNTLCILPMETRLVINLSDNSPADDLYGVQRYSDSTTNIYDDGTFTQNSSTMWGGITSSDIISFALDLDNGKLFLAKNGAYKNQSGATGDPVNGTNPTFTISDTTKTYGFYTEMRGNDNNGTIMNFGNGYFGTSAVTSAGTAGSTPGTFEYDVPSGYQPLSTKGLNA